MNYIKVKKLDNSAILPIKGSEKAAGYDLCSNENFILSAGERKAIGTGIALAIPIGHYGRIAPRSGLAFKNGLDVLAGVIDEDYRGEIKVILLNTSDSNFTSYKGDRIAQLIIETISHPEVQEVIDLDETIRADGGFGSTGVR